MTLKRVLFAVGVLALLGLVFAQQPLQVALVIAQGGLGDLSYNDLAYSGLQRAAKDFAGKVVVRTVQSQDIVSQGESVLRTAAKGGFDLVINLEYSIADALRRVATDYPNTKFAMFNLELQGPNITSVLFREHEGSYLVGALAAIATVKTGVPGINPQKVIGVIGGTKSPGIDKFIVGYVEGAKSIDPSIRVLVSYANDFGDPAKGKELAKAMFDQGADIIYQVAGGTGQGVIEAAKETGRFAIGVDSDQDYLAPGRVLTSMIKRADTAVYQLVKRLVEGKLEGGVTLNFGLANNGVGISSMRYTRSIFTSTDLARIDQIRRDIISGKIKPTDITTVPDPAAVYRRLGLGR
jgi:basic membrane protein A